MIEARSTEGPAAPGPAPAAPGAVVEAAAGLAPLGRLVPRREALARFDTFAPLLAGHDLRLVDADGRTLAERPRAAGDAAPSGGAARFPIAAAGVELGSLEVTPPPDGAAAEAAAEALRTSLVRAAESAVGRRALVAETLERYREVNMLYRLGELLGGATDADALPRHLLGEAMGAIAADAAVLVLDEGADGDTATACLGTEGPEVLCAALERTRAGAGAEARGAVVVGGDGVGPRLAIRVWAQLRTRDRVLGALMLTRPEGAAAFTAADAKLLSSLATQAAAFIDSARLQRRGIEQARMARELQLAHDVQARLMPQTLPQRPGWHVAASWRAAREVAGDFYDALAVDDDLVVTVGDVADKGMPAAIFMALTRSVLRAGVAPGRAPGQVVGSANALLCQDAADGMFVTLVHAHLHPDGRARYANAGHNPPLLIRRDGRVERLGRTGILVGWDEDAAFGDATVRLEAGDVLVLYTDGVTEALDAADRAFGEERLEELAVAARGGGAGAVLDALVGALASFERGRDPYDDATLLVVSREGAGAAPGRR